MKTNTDKQSMGGAGERKAAALLTMAVCAQTSHGTLDEDGGKVDLKLSFRSALLPASVITAHCQVKSGVSFRTPSSTKEVLTLTVGSETLQALADGTQPAFLAWVSPKPHARVYWQPIGPDRKLKATVKIPCGQFVTPSLRLDLSRIHAFREHRKRLPVVNLPNTPDPGIAHARDEYKKLKATPVSSPIMGEIRFTRMAWRHVTRRSRDTVKRQRSFVLLRYLRSLLSSSPNRFLIVRRPRERFGGRTRETREVILWYYQAINESGRPCDVLVRLIECVEYPSNWSRYGLAPSDVTVSTTVKSWWYKPSKP